MICEGFLSAAAEIPAVLQLRKVVCNVVIHWQCSIQRRSIPIDDGERKCFAYGNIIVAS